MGKFLISGLKLEKMSSRVLKPEINIEIFAQPNRLMTIKLGICGKIFKRRSKPNECSIFGTACKPETPIGIVWLAVKEPVLHIINMEIYYMFDK